MTEYYDLATKELIPLYPKIGMKAVGSFRSLTGNMNQTYALYVFDDLAAFQKITAARLKDLAFQKVSAKMSALRISQTSTLLEPNAWSPMK
jgi:hypothetical protein